MLTTFHTNLRTQKQDSFPFSFATNATLFPEISISRGTWHNGYVEVHSMLTACMHLPFMMSELMYLWMTGRRCVSQTLRATTAVPVKGRACRQETAVFPSLRCPVLLFHEQLSILASHLHFANPSRNSLMFKHCGSVALSNYNVMKER